MGPVHMRIPAVMVPAIFALALIACELGMGSEAVSTGDLLLFNNATASIVVSLACVYYVLGACPDCHIQSHGRTAGISKHVHVLLCPPHQTAILVPVQGRNQGEAPSGQVALGVPGVTVLPGAVTPDGKYVLNPAVGALNPPDEAIRTPSLVVTHVKAAQPKVPSCATTAVHMACSLLAAGFTRCARLEHATSQDHIWLVQAPH